MIVQPKFHGVHPEVDFAEIELRFLAHITKQSTPKSKQELYCLLYGGALPMKKIYDLAAIKNNRINLDTPECPEEILEAIRDGQGFRCEARDNDHSKWVHFVVTGISALSTYKYHGFECDIDGVKVEDAESEFRHVRCIVEVPRKVVKSKVEILEDLLSRGYTLSQDKTFYRADCCYNFRQLMFNCCGESPSGNFTWSEHWLENAGSSQEIFNTMD